MTNERGAPARALQAIACKRPLRLLLFADALEGQECIDVIQSVAKMGSRWSRKPALSTKPPAAAPPTPRESLWRGAP
ncbi:MAG: hypothetical protein AAFX79_10260 [Planctomycetota bacterium]